MAELRKQERIFITQPIAAELCFYEIGGKQVDADARKIEVTIENFSLSGMGLMGKVFLPPKVVQQERAVPILFLLRWKFQNQFYEVFGEIPWTEDRRKTPQHPPKFFYGFEFKFTSQQQFTKYYAFYNAYTIAKKIRRNETHNPHNWNQYDAKNLKAIYNPQSKEES